MRDQVSQDIGGELQGLPVLRGCDNVPGAAFVIPQQFVGRNGQCNDK